jgi:DNA polymerase-3 subunit gamma/tau
MGTVSNVVYEHILQAVHANNSADVIAIIAKLLDAGNGPPQLARQFVRYLRNATVAKITKLSPDTPATGIAADLLQISPEERSRSARSAALFTEEELSRFLAIMLRTFDELGYRQEQRFHLELGLLKLVHVQRLVPIEELLTQLGPAPTPKPNTQPSQISATVAPSAPPVPAIATRPAPATPKPEAPRSPDPKPDIFAQATPAIDSVRKTPTPFAKEVEQAQPETNGSMALARELAPAASIPTPAAVERPQLVATPVAFAEIVMPEAATDVDLSALQSAMVDALNDTKGQQSASDAIDNSTFSLSGETVSIQTTVSKPMLPILINVEADRLLKSVLRAHNPAWKLLLIPGTPAGNKAKKPRAAAAGSVAELAEKHPVVQQARQLFNAEISNVIDLRDKD